MFLTRRIHTMTTGKIARRFHRYILRIAEHLEMILTKLTNQRSPMCLYSMPTAPYLSEHIQQPEPRQSGPHVLFRHTCFHLLSRLQCGRSSQHHGNLHCRFTAAVVIIHFLHYPTIPRHSEDESALHCCRPAPAGFLTASTRDFFFLVFFSFELWSCRTCRIALLEQR